jgi:heptosyltransferase-3
MAHFAIICASGIGDALILQIASYYLTLEGHQTTTFSNHLHLFGAWLPKKTFHCQPLLNQLESTFTPFDAILLQHDNTPKAQAIISLRPKIPVYSFYTNYRLNKHGPLIPEYDFPFDDNLSMVANVAAGLKALFSIDAAECKNGLTPPPGLLFKKHPKRIAIHPTSSFPTKNWPREKFLKIASWLTKNGYDPVFVTAPSERSEWSAPLFSSLEELTSFLYESGGFLGNDSGPGHIASYLKIPHIIIGSQEKNMRLWRPGWHPGHIVIPARWIPNWKWLKLRDKKGKHLITTNKIIKTLKESVLIK